MRFTLLTFCAAAVVAATLVPGSAALAESGPAPEGGREAGISLTAGPSTVGPGGEADLRLAGCAGRTATGESDAFVSAARFSPAAGGGLFAEARISSEARPGDHTVHVTCTDDKAGTGTNGATATATAKVTVTGRGRATPLAPVAAGGGAALFAAGDGGQEGPGTTHTATGLVVAAVAAVAVALRGRRRRDRGPATD